VPDDELLALCVLRQSLHGDGEEPHGVHTRLGSRLKLGSGA